MLYALARTESYFDAQAKSPKNAWGLMQLLQSTAAQEGLKPGEDLLTPQVNLALGAKHFSRLLNQFNNSYVYAIAAYNAGAAPVERWQSRSRELNPEMWTELISYPETKNYVKKVLQAESIYRDRLAAPAAAGAVPSPVPSDSK